MTAARYGVQSAVRVSDAVRPVDGPGTGRGPLGGRLRRCQPFKPGSRRQHRVSPSRYVAGVLGSAGVAEWTSLAACRGRTEMFFPPWEARWDPAPALAICDRCPVAWPCLSEALERGERVGVFGGFDLDEDRQEAQRLRRQEQGAAYRQRQARNREEDVA